MAIVDGLRLDIRLLSDLQSMLRVCVGRIVPVRHRVHGMRRVGRMSGSGRLWGRLKVGHVRGDDLRLPFLRNEQLGE